jgi:hypothetical protein
LSSSSAVLTPDSIEYEQSIKRWSDAAEKRAVGLPKFMPSHASFLSLAYSVTGC